MVLTYLPHGELTLKKLVCLFGWFPNVLVNYYVISRTGPKTERLTILRAATHETELGDHSFCLSRHIILTPTQPVGSGRPQRGSNPGPPHQESRALPPPPPPPKKLTLKSFMKNFTKQEMPGIQQTSIRIYRYSPDLCLFPLISRKQPGYENLLSCVSIT